MTGAAGAPPGADLPGRARPRALAPLWARVMLGAGSWTLLVRGLILLPKPHPEWATGVAFALEALAIGAIIELGTSPFRPRIALLHAATLALPLLGVLAVEGDLPRILAGTAFGWLGIATTGATRGVLELSRAERRAGEPPGRPLIDRVLAGVVGALTTIGVAAGALGAVSVVVVVLLGERVLEDVLFAAGGAALVLAFEAGGRGGVKCGAWLAAAEARRAAEAARHAATEARPA